MKPFIHPVKNLPPALGNPFNRAALPLFFVLAFMPSILHLAPFRLPIINLLTALGPAAAAFWFAISQREIRVNYLLLGAPLTVVLWAANWLMLAEPCCCSPDYH